MSTPHHASKTSSALCQGSSAMPVPQTPFTFMPSSLPLDSTLDGLNALNTSVTTLPAEDTSAVRTPSQRSRYVAPMTRDKSAGPSSSPGQSATETVKPVPINAGTQKQADPIQSTLQDDVESQISSSSSTRASDRNRKAPACYGSPVRHSVKEVEEGAATSPSTGQVGSSSPVTPKRRFVRRNTEDFIQPSSSSNRQHPKEIVFKN